MRTSPTNIGLWMVSTLGAHDFGYLTMDEVVHKLTRTMETIAGLERHEAICSIGMISNAGAAEPALRVHVDSATCSAPCGLWIMELPR